MVNKQQAIQTSGVLFIVAIATFGMRLVDRSQVAGAEEAATKTTVDAAVAKNIEQDAKLIKLETRTQKNEVDQMQVTTQQTAIMNDIDRMQQSLQTIAEHILKKPVQ